MPKFVGTLTAAGDAPVINDSDIAGGYRVVANETERLQLKYERRKVGMLVLQQDTGIFYRLVSVGNQGQNLIAANFVIHKVNGSPGSDGTPGPPGATGPEGPPGATGLVGPGGAQGPQGHQGASGVQGSIGKTGATGGQGFQGLAGFIGPSPTGNPGPRGATGTVQGPVGLQGFTGPAGLSGSPGATGSTTEMIPLGPWTKNYTITGVAATNNTIITGGPTPSSGTACPNPSAGGGCNPGKLRSNYIKLTHNLSNSTSTTLTYVKFHDLGSINGNTITNDITFTAFSAGHMAQFQNFDQTIDYKYGMIIYVCHYDKLQDIYFCNFSFESRQKNAIGIYTNNYGEEKFPMLCIGNGHILVNSQGGNIQIGDFICSSDQMGVGMKQEEANIKNYTVAKSMENVVWEDEQVQQKLINCVFVAG